MPKGSSAPDDAEASARAVAGPQRHRRGVATRLLATKPALACNLHAFRGVLTSRAHIHGAPRADWWRRLGPVRRIERWHTRAAKTRAAAGRARQRGVAAHHIVLAGFSQGGNIALNAALRYPQALAGALILSSYLSLQARVAVEASAANRSLPIFMAHGTADDVVPYAMADGARTCLSTLGYQVQWHEYAMSHTVCAQEVVDIGNWLVKRLTV